MKRLHYLDILIILFPQVILANCVIDTVRSSSDERREDNLPNLSEVTENGGEVEPSCKEANYNRLLDIVTEKHLRRMDNFELLRFAYVGDLSFLKRKRHVAEALMMNKLIDEKRGFVYIISCEGELVQTYEVDYNKTREIWQFSGPCFGDRMYAPLFLGDIPVRSSGSPYGEDNTETPVALFYNEGDWCERIAFAFDDVDGDHYRTWPLPSLETVPPQVIHSQHDLILRRLLENEELVGGNTGARLHYLSIIGYLNVNNEKYMVIHLQRDYWPMISPRVYGPYFAILDEDFKNVDLHIWDYFNCAYPLRCEGNRLYLSETFTLGDFGPGYSSRDDESTIGNVLEFTGNRFEFNFVLE
ncbi:MAG: hypothetical protein NUW37_05960 [Planctomycetes bacterium]|nr:hypothetical protein [Planctomycetota bacterium]